MFWPCTDLRTLARVKRKREEQSAHRQLSHRAAADSLSGTATSHARSMASFIQSALGSEGGDGEGEGWRAVEEDEGGTSRPTTGGGSASVTGGKAPSRGGKRKRGATAKRRPGLGQYRLEPVLESVMGSWYSFCLTSFPALPTPAFVSQPFPPQLLSQSRGEKLHGCETKAGVGRTGNETTFYSQARQHSSCSWSFPIIAL